MSRTKFQELEDLTAEYGQERVRFCRRVKEIGAKILKEYSRYRGAE